MESPTKRAWPLLAGFLGGILGAMIALAASDYYNNYAWAPVNIIDLRIHPIGYEDDSIAVTGYLVNDESSTKLYFDRESGELGDRTLHFDVHAAKSDHSETLSKCKDGYVWISGAFTRERSEFFYIRADRIFYVDTDESASTSRQCIP